MSRDRTGNQGGAQHAVLIVQQNAADASNPSRSRILSAPIVAIGSTASSDEMTNRTPLGNKACMFLPDYGINPPRSHERCYSHP